MNPPVTLITLTHNKLDITRRCLSTWLDTAYSPWQLVVIENGSSDGTPDWLESFRAKAALFGVMVTIIRNTANIGCSTARNQGIAASGSPYIAFLDNDVAIRSRQWLSVLVRAMEADRSIAAIGPKLVYPWPPHDIQCAGVAITPTGRVVFRGRGKPRVSDPFQHRMDVQCLISASMLVQKPVLDEVGGFDEAFNPVQFEDFDLCYRMRQRGYKVVYEPSAEMYHFESVTTAGTPAIPNTGVIIRHGLLFKKRWRNMFEREDGPSEAEAAWRRVFIPDLRSLDRLPLVD